MTCRAVTWHERLPTDQSAHGEGTDGVIRRHVVSYVFIAVLTMINKNWVAYLAFVHRYWRLVHFCCFVDQFGVNVQVRIHVQHLGHTRQH